MLIEKLKSKFNIKDISKDKIEIEENNHFEIIKTLKDEFNYNLTDLTVIDYLEYVEAKESRFYLVYILRNINEVLIILMPTTNLKVESITPLFKSADWLEREAYDQYGITFINHPNLKRILNHHQFEGHPLRKDYPTTKYQLCNDTQDLMDEMSLKLLNKGLIRENEAPILAKSIELDTNLMFLNLGPSHPATHGTIRTLIAIDGEDIKCAVSEIGYLHRGFEKSAENHTYNQVIPYTDRLNYCSAIMNNVGFAKAVEDMMGLTIPDRAIFIRVILSELSRIIDHLVCNGANLVDMGALTNFWYLFNPREEAYKLLTKLTGARLTNSYTRVGGVSYDFYDGFEKDLKFVLDSVQKGVSDTLALIDKNRIFHDRTQNVAIMSGKEALSYGFSGPALRASGEARDLRKDKPYYYYDSFDFDVAVGSVGDVYDRIMVRFIEIEESIKIINQAMNMIPKGEINLDNRAVVLPKKSEVYNSIEGMINHFKLIYEGIHPPKGEFYSATEGANGELGYFIVSDGSGKPYKVKVRPPCFFMMSAFAEMIEEHKIADAIVNLGSLNIIAGELDR